MNASMVVAALRADPLAVDKLKTDPTIPMESVAPAPAPALSPEHQTFYDSIPATSHLRDHVNYFNEEQMHLTKEALHTGGNPSGWDIVDTRTVTYGGISIGQYKYRLKVPVWSRRVWLPVAFQHRAILHRRHTHAPGVDFIVPLTDDIVPFLTKVDTQILTIRPGHVPGTGFAGTHFPGSDDPEDFTGILYKWYSCDKDRQQDIDKFARGIHDRIPALIDAVDYARLMRSC